MREEGLKTSETLSVLITPLLVRARPETQAPQGSEQTGPSVHV